MSINQSALAKESLRVCLAEGAKYADIRIIRIHSEEIRAKENRVTSVDYGESFGAGIRVLINGAWGFSATSQLHQSELKETAKRACAQARAYSKLRAAPVTLAPAKAQCGSWQTPIRTDPFSLPVSVKADFLLGLNAAALKLGASYSDAFIWSVHEHKCFFSSEGCELTQDLHRIWPQVTPTLIDSRLGRFETRSTLSAPMGSGFEYVEQFPFDTEIEQAVEGAKNKLTAPAVEPGTWDIILHPSHLWLTIHETCGHATELDRALGYEANYAGTSFITPDKRGVLKYASPLVTITGNRTEPGGLATCGFDDEGVAASQFPIIHNGVFVDYQTTREHAPLLGNSPSRACAYADSWCHMPLQRMPNISLQPGDEPLTFAQLIANTDRALLFLGDNSWSIDQQRYQFQFSAQETWKIEKGRITSMVRDAVYHGNTVQFWNSCDAICDKREYALGGSFFCGKGQPPQCAPVSHGSVPARFRNIAVLNTGAT